MPTNWKVTQPRMVSSPKYREEHERIFKKKPKLRLGEIEPEVEQTEKPVKKMR